MTVLDRYATARRRDRLHVGIRWRSCPFDEVEAATPTSGRILDLGCGHGVLSLLLARRAPERQVTGIDLDANKIVVAERARAMEPSLPVEFRVGTAAEVPAGPWDAVVIVDVLYLLDSASQGALLRTVAGQLAPGGLLVIKEMSRAPAWKFAWSRAQEQLAVRVLHITAGHHIHFPPDEAMPAALEDAGLTVIDDRRVDRGYLHPHRLLVARQGLEARVASGRCPAAKEDRPLC